MPIKTAPGLVPFFKDRLRRIPGLAPLYRRLRAAWERFRLRRMSAQEVFTEIFRANRWGGTSSVSGSGSDLEQTRVLRHALPSLVQELDVTTVLDIPCGDFNWMKEVDLGRINYLGADIVTQLIKQNESLYGNAVRRFLRVDLLKDRLPRADLVLCRDCLVHFSFRDIRIALENIRASGARYLLTTTFPSRRANEDIVTGQWAPLNLEAPPFSLPPPWRLINEQCTEENGAYSDKSLGLWIIGDP